MSETYQAFYQNEVRALQITVNSQDGSPFAPSGAFVAVEDSTGATVVEEQAAQIIANTVTTLIGKIVTGTVGKYKIIWRLTTQPDYGGPTLYEYYHISELEVMEL